MVTGSQKSLGSLNREQAHPPVPYLNILRTRMMMMIELKLSCHVKVHLACPFFIYSYYIILLLIVVLRTVDLINAIFVLLQIFVR